MFEKDQTKAKSSGIWPLAFLGGAVVAVAVVLLIFLSPASDGVLAAVEGMAREGDPLFAQYQDLLKLENESLETTFNFSGARAVVFSGVFYNGTEKAIDAVELKLLLFNYDKKVWEAVRTALRPESERGVVPAYEARELNIFVEELPDVWIGEHAEIEVSGFRFAESEE